MLLFYGFLLILSLIFVECSSKMTNDTPAPAPAPASESVSVLKQRQPASSCYTMRQATDDEVKSNSPPKSPLNWRTLGQHERNLEGLREILKRTRAAKNNASPVINRFNDGSVSK